MTVTNYTPWSVLAVVDSCTSVVIIGAGIAGACLAHEFARRGVAVSVFDKLEKPAMGASGNQVGLMMPALTTDYNHFAEFYLEAYKYSIQHAISLKKQTAFFFKQSGIVQFAFNERQLKRQLEWLKLNQYDNQIQAVAKEDIVKLTGLDFNYPAIYFPNGAWLSPKEFVNVHLDHPRINVVCDVEITSLTRRNSLWEMKSGATVVATSQLVILANAYSIDKLLPDLPMRLRKVRGQLSAIESDDHLKKLKLPVTYDGYITPSNHGVHYLGATFHDSMNTNTTFKDRLENLKQFQQIYPSYSEFNEQDLTRDSAAIRSISTDYLPIIGPVPDVEYYKSAYYWLFQDRRVHRYPQANYLPGLFVSVAHGSRGMISAPFAAKLLADEILDAKLSISSVVREQIHPGKFLIRDIKKGKFKS